MMKSTWRGVSLFSILGWAGAAAATTAPPSQPVPALGPGGWATLSLLLVGAGFVALRRRPPK